MKDPLLYEDAFNLLCGRLLGEGIHRQVFLCKVDPSLVVKVESDTTYWTGSNAAEWANWNDFMFAPAYNKWMCPCLHISPNSRVMIQKRTTPIPAHLLPTEIPAWMMDVKWENFGMLNGQVVLHDYPRINGSVSKKMVKMTPEQWNP